MIYQNLSIEILMYLYDDGHTYVCDGDNQQVIVWGE